MDPIIITISISYSIG